MNLVEKHIIRKGHKWFGACDRVCFLCKNLYNYVLFENRKQFIATGKIYSMKEFFKMLRITNQPDFRALPSQVAKEVVRLHYKNWLSFFAAVKSHRKNASKFTGRPRLPKYKKQKGDTKYGRFIACYYFPEAISRKALKQGIIKLSGIDIQIDSRGRKVKMVRIVPKYGRYVIEVVYEVPTPNLQAANQKEAALELGVNNLGTVVFNTGDHPVIINGRPLKSINQYFNKKKAELMSYVGGKGHSQRLEKLHLNRDNKIQDFLHKHSTLLMNYLASKGITKLYVGKNQGWKQSIKIGKRNNQNFVSIPFDRFIQMLIYKGALRGIKVICHEESYTSKCSCLDREAVKKHLIYKGKRIKRGMFKSNKGILINADVNAAYNIGRKSNPEFLDRIEVLPLVPRRLIA